MYVQLFELTLLNIFFRKVACETNKIIKKQKVIHGPCLLYLNKYTYISNKKQSTNKIAETYLKFIKKRNIKYSVI